jgi:Protein of unknown function (DUF992)
MFKLKSAMSYRPVRTLTAFGVAAVLTSGGASAQQSSQGVPNNTQGTNYSAAGTLACDISAGLGLIVGSSRTMTCTFTPNQGRPEIYEGSIRRFGLDVGVTAQTQLVWAVLATTTTLRPGILAGEYVGTSADASLGLGAGANLLVGGSNRSVSLQPLSVQAQAGINVAAGVSQLTLALNR